MSGRLKRIGLFDWGDILRHFSVDCNLQSTGHLTNDNLVLLWAQSNVVTFVVTSIDFSRAEQKQQKNVAASRTRLMSDFFKFGSHHDHHDMHGDAVSLSGSSNLQGEDFANFASASCKGGFIDKSSILAIQFI
jgi:hypothetical protein